MAPSHIEQAELSQLVTNYKWDRNLVMDVYGITKKVLQRALKNDYAPTGRRDPANDPELLSKRFSDLAHSNDAGGLRSLVAARREAIAAEASGKQRSRTRSVPPPAKPANLLERAKSVGKNSSDARRASGSGSATTKASTKAKVAMDISSDDELGPEEEEDQLDTSQAVLPDVEMPDAEQSPPPEPRPKKKSRNDRKHTTRVLLPDLRRENSDTPTLDHSDTAATQESSFTEHTITAHPKPRKASPAVLVQPKNPTISNNMEVRAPLHEAPSQEHSTSATQWKNPEEFLNTLKRPLGRYADALARCGVVSGQDIDDLILLSEDSQARLMDGLRESEGLSSSDVVMIMYGLQASRPNVA